MPKVRWRPPYIQTKPYSFAPPPSDDVAPRSQTRSYAPTSTPTGTRAEGATLREAAAYHESGHCLINLVQGRNVHSLSINDSGGGSFRAEQPIHVTEEKEGLVFEALTEDVGTDYRPHAFRQVTGYLGGLCAELRYGADPEEARETASVDLYRARRIAEKVCDDADDVEQFLDNAQRKAEEHIERNWRLVGEIASALNARGRLTGDDVAAIVENYPVVKPPEPKQAPKREATTSSRPYQGRGPEALGLQATAARMPPLSMHERACSPHDEHLFRLRMRFLDSRGY